VKIAQSDVTLYDFNKADRVSDRVKAYRVSVALFLDNVDLFS